jgi:hypothetical protein
MVHRVSYGLPKEMLDSIIFSLLVHTLHLDFMILMNRLSRNYDDFYMYRCL